MEEIGPEAACQQLRQMRDEQVRDSHTIVEIGERLVTKYSHRFGDEMWLICEQVFLAALDICRYDLSRLCLTKLYKRFPQSMRVKKLQGIQHEAFGEYDEALTLYEEIEKEDPTNAAARKRKTAVFKAQGQINDAIKSLTEYLKTFMADAEAWMELADLYTEELEYGKAAYCMEELILQQPFNHLFHQRYAEIRYTQGGMENFEHAKQHFAQAVYLSHHSNIRALYGLMLTSNQLVSGKSEKERKKNNTKYATWAAKMIGLQYKQTWEKGEDEARTPSVGSDSLAELTSSATDLLEKTHLGAAT